MSSLTAAPPPARPRTPAHRPERLLVSATFVTSLGNSIQLTAAAIVMVYTTQSTLSVGWVFVAFSVPAVVLSLLFGRLADRFDRRRLCIGCDLLSAAVAGFLPTWLLLGGSPAVGIYATTIGLAAINAMLLPASNALIKERVAEARLGVFNAHFEIALQLGTLLSTAIGGFVVQLYGAEPLFYFNAITFLASAALFTAMGPPPRRSAAGVGHRDRLAASRDAEPVTRTAQPAIAPPVARLGMLYALGNPIITVSNTLIVVLVIQTFQQGAGVLGVVDALAGVGFLVAAALYKIVSRRSPDLHTALVGYLACAALVMAQPRLGVAGLMVLLPLGTLAFGAARISCRTMLMRAAPHDRAGTVFGATNAFGLAFSVAATIAISGVADRHAVHHGFTSLALLIAGTAALAVALVWPLRHHLDARPAGRS